MISMPATVVAVSSSTTALGWAATAARGDGGVVVAPDVDVGDAEVADPAEGLVLRGAAPVDDVAGVQHAVDVELGDHLADQVRTGRVQVDVGDVQQGDAVPGRRRGRAAWRPRSTAC